MGGRPGKGGRSGGHPRVTKVTKVTKGDARLCEKALFSLFVIAMKAPHFCHPERSEGSQVLNDGILHCIQNDRASPCSGDFLAAAQNGQKKYF